MFFFIVTSSFSNEYWIDANAPSNNQSCIKDFPCSKFENVINKLVAGDIVFIVDGVYENILLDKIKGKPSFPIMIKAVGDNAYFFLYIEGRIPDTLEVRNTEFLIIDGLKFINAKRAAIRVNNSTNITIRNTEIKNSYRWGIFTNHTNFILIENNYITGSSREHGIYISNSGDNVSLVENKIFGALGCGIHMNGDLSMGGGTYSVGDGIISNVLISKNLIENVGEIGGAAINLDGIENIKVTENILWNVKSAGITVFKHNGAIVSKNVDIAKNIIKLSKDSRWALIVMKGSSNILFNNNIVFTENIKKGVFELYSTLNQTTNFITKIKRKLGFDSMTIYPLASDYNVFFIEGNIASLDNKFYKTLSSLQLIYRGVELNSKQYKTTNVLLTLAKFKEQLMFSEIGGLVESLLLHE